MSDPMEEIRASFFIECEELLESLQDGLQAMADGDDDAETINVVFRAVHSIKGGAGAFGLDDLVRFAHRFETAMDEVRAGRLQPDADALKLFFVSADLLADLVRSARDGTDAPDDVISDVLAGLDALGGAAPAEPEDDFEFQPMALSFDFADPAPAAPAGFAITFTPSDALYASGNEPLYLLRNLRELGESTVRCNTGALPDLPDIDPERAFISWDITLHTAESENTLREVFEFVDGLCTLDIQPLHAPLSDILPPPPADMPALPAPIEADRPEPPAATPDTPRNPAEPRSDTAQANPTVRVDLARIDRLVNLVGELVINQAMLSQSVVEAGLPPNSAVVTGLEEFMQLTRDIQESVMMIRAQPIKSLFQRMARIVREGSAAVNKDVRFVTEGENTEVDKTVIERLADPLTHMLRNAVDHGLESTEKRIAAGKPARGVVTLRALHRSGRILIEISDDGGGINRARVRQIATDKGLIPADAQLSDSDIDNLLFLPGFSTASEVSNLSGRGVGMDVVRSAIQALGGRITISSTPGEGTTFAISLPLTLAVLDGMVIRVAGETLIVPLSAVLETLSLTDKDLRALGPQTHVLQIRGGFVPLLDLGAELGYRQPKQSYVGGIVLLIGQDDGQRAALVVDAIEDQRQVVIKGLEASYGRVPGIAAATILGDGQIALILDPVDLVKNASGRTRIPSTPISLAG